MAKLAQARVPQLYIGPFTQRGRDSRAPPLVSAQPRGSGQRVPVSAGLHLRASLRCRLRGAGMRCACCGSSLWRPNAWRSPAASWMISAGTSGSPPPPRSFSLGAAPTSVLPPPLLGSALLLNLGSPYLFPGSTMHPSLGSPPLLGLSTEPGPRVALPVPGPLFSPWP